MDQFIAELPGFEEANSMYDYYEPYFGEHTPYAGVTQILRPTRTTATPSTCLRTRFAHCSSRCAALPSAPCAWGISSFVLTRNLASTRLGCLESQATGFQEASRRWRFYCSVIREFLYAKPAERPRCATSKFIEDHAAVAFRDLSLGSGQRELWQRQRRRARFVCQA